jgi:hypothetical protein
MSNDKTQATFHGTDDYNQHQLHVQHGWDYPPSAELDEHDGLLTQPSRSRKSWIVPLAVAGIISALIALAIGLRVSNVVPVGVPLIGKDPGIAACQALADGTKPTGQDKSLTAEEYKTMRRVFSGSWYPEIKKPGLEMVDLIWQFQGSDNKNDLGKALLLVGPMTQAYSSLAGGCAEHDIVIPALGQ